LADAYLPELLAHPAWEIAPHELWELSVEAYDSRKRWLDVMALHPRWQAIHTWFITLAKDSLHMPAEIMIDRMVGVSEENKGPFYQYFFSPDVLATHPYSYLLHLSALSTIRERLRQYRPEGQLTLKEFLEFIELNKQFKRTIRVTQQSNINQGVQLMTAHKAKGLEFPHVYIMNSVESVWGESARGKNRLISYPHNLALADAGNTSDDKLRLLYVALTRAKHNLSISYSSTNEKGKPTMLAGFLADKEGASLEVEVPATTPIGTQAAELAWTERLSEPSTKLQDVLQPLLEKYKLSPTHFSNFLDVSKGGPKQFMLERLLHFPTTPSANAAYGSAIHALMQQLHTHISAGEVMPPLEDILLWFETALKRERLLPEDFGKLLQKGHDHLRIFLGQRQDMFSPTQTAEAAFDHQGVVVGEARLTGKIDVIDKNSELKTVTVTDYKTARPHTTWKTSNPFQQVQLHQYQQQLLFYTLLIENSRDYRGFTVEQAQLEFVRPDNKGTIVEPLKASLEDEAISGL
ncbi:MAG TPA: 3'-5' exonuclease, partial [Candidatus Saccharibacteria bacterium]|nr:3'-5' exonuclease [Candidatus Saccharibacteria bacterium]